MFETIKRAHIATGHGGRDKMVKELSKYANITRDTVELFQSLCSVSKETEDMCDQGSNCVNRFYLRITVHDLRWTLLTCSLAPKESISG